MPAHANARDKPSVSQTSSFAPSAGTRKHTRSLLASGKTLHSTIGRPYEDELAPQPKQRTAVRVAALVGPALLLLGLLAHTVLEGLAIGLQVRTL